MKQFIPGNNVMLPSDHEREQIFYWLKKISSVTAWRRIFEYYKSWAEVTENSVRLADNNGWADKTSIPESDYVLILKSLAHCEEGVLRLSKGDKRVFKCDANGEFEMARRILSHWVQMKTRVDEGENGIDEAHTPLWSEFKVALMATAHAWGECSTEILEPNYLDEPGLTLYGDWLKDTLKVLPFPSQMRPVPDPTENTFVRTNEDTPYSGIWEPIEASLKKNPLLSLFTSPTIPQPPFKIMGAMNYLHGGSKAPRITVETTTDNMDLDTTWRLIWRDDRYSDGSIPDEEIGYQFTQPTQLPPRASAIVATKETVWADSGTACPVSGRWLVESDLSISKFLQNGENLPFHMGRNVRWVLAEN
jgi:hypothetical protein